MSKPMPALIGRLPFLSVIISLAGALEGCSGSAAPLADRGGGADSRPDQRQLAATDLGPERGRSADARGDSPSTPALCPGGKPFSGGGISGLYEGTATVPAGKFNKGGDHPAILAVASICGTLRGLLRVEQSADDYLAGTPTYKIKAQPGGASFVIVASDRYCPSTDCGPHLGVGMEIFEASATWSAPDSLTVGKAAVKAGVSYPDLELPFTALKLTRTFPSAAQQPEAPVAGAWKAKLVTTSEVFADPPCSGDNVLTLSAQAVTGWKVSAWDNALDDPQMFPSALLAADVRRVGITQTPGIGYQAVLDGSWLVGVIRDAKNAGSPSLSPEVPTDFTNDDALIGIWIGARGGAD